MFNILIMSQAQVRFATYDKPYAIIGLRGINETFPKYQDSSYLVDVLTLSVDDITEPEENKVLFSYIHALQILNFVEKYKNTIDLLIIHCNAGISRSPAVAASLSIIYNINDYHTYFFLYEPNIHVFSTLMSVYATYKRDILEGRIKFPDKPLIYNNKELQSEIANVSPIIRLDKNI
ncbi:MAG TPA: hypothetical protein ENG48_04420 [Candidatus Atribacteria bacterium]|nr:hypothetical protein [Candidatus Atribacteria bacterium]